MNIQCLGSMSDRGIRRWAPFLRVAMRGLLIHLPTFWAERDGKHGERRRQVGRGFNSDGVACCEWRWQRFRRIKNKSLDCHFKIAVLSQPARVRIGTSERRWSKKLQFSCARSCQQGSKAAFLFRRRCAKSTPAERAVAFSGGRIQANEARGCRVE